MNSFLKEVRLAARSGKPTSQGLVIAEGPNLLAEAIRGVWQLVKIVCTETAHHRHRLLIGQAQCEVEIIAARLFGQLTATENAQELLILLQPRVWHWLDLFRPQPALVVVCDGMQDPGNVGTIVRSAEAFGATGIVLLSGSVRATNGKLLRAAAGSLFRVPYLEDISGADLVRRVQGDGYPLYALHPRAETRLQSTPLARDAVVVVGNEGSGVSPLLLASSQAVAVQTKRVESLNAAIACSVLLHDAYQKRGSA